MMLKTFIVAEIGTNHGGSIQRMKDLMLAARDCGCDYVKGQKRCPRVLLSKNRYDAFYNSPHSFGKTYGEHREVLEFSVAQWEELFSFAANNKIELFASVFDLPSAIVMKELGMKIFKVGSGQITNLNLIEYCDSVAKTLIISTGMSTEREVNSAFNVLDKCLDIVYMHTTSSYPTTINNINLSIIKRKVLYTDTMTPVKYGLSGHYLDYSGLIESAAVAVGATWIERHFTLDKEAKGSDQLISLHPNEMKNVIESIRKVEKAMGNDIKTILPCEESCRKINRV